ncbi:MAG TPA: DHA2 family efflux MFS transporter permease subunit [Gemmataceae bacterium]|nr:DHA2 family efflux MFS transporter permease subunit [Gemmataceae bacterium]
MSSMALTPTAVSRPAVNQWIVAVVVVIPTFMEILDTTIANVALRYIAGGLAAAQTDSDWVITSYLAANAIVLPITGWLSAHLGRRRYFLLSIALFTLASAACGFATSLGQIILFRIIQGLAGGGLVPSSQGILMDAFPPEKQGTAMTLFGVAAILGPIVGPTLGGWLCVNYDWRYIFLINVPIGIFSLIAGHWVVEDPNYVKQEVAEYRKKPLNFDFIGLGVLALVMSCWEIMLSKGQEWDWLGDPFWRVQTLLVLFVLGLGFLIYHELRTESPIINFRCLKERNLSLSCVIIFSAFVVVYCSCMALPSLLQGLFNYDALRSGMMMSPSGISSMVAMVVAGALMGRQLDARWLVLSGLVIMAVASYARSRMNLQIGPWQVIWPHMLLMLGIGFVFAPINVAAFRYTPPELRAAAVGLLNLLRTEGGSVGTSLTKIIQDRRDQLHLSRIVETLNPLTSHVREYLESTRVFFFQRTGDPVRSLQLGLNSLDEQRQQQAAAFAYLDVFFLCAVLSIALVLLVVFMKRSVAEKGERISAE